MTREMKEAWDQFLLKGHTAGWEDPDRYVAFLAFQDGWDGGIWHEAKEAARERQARKERQPHRWVWYRVEHKIHYWAHRDAHDHCTCEGTGIYEYARG